MYRRSAGGLSESIRLHAERADSITRTYEVLFDEVLLDVVALGRVEPYGHYHYRLRDRQGRLVIPDYVNYEAYAELACRS